MKGCEGQISLFDVLKEQPEVIAESEKMVKVEEQKPICQFSGHVCNKQAVWDVADALDDKEDCPHVCCRQCKVKGCGARCNGAEEPKEVIEKSISLNCDSCDVKWCSLICFERRGYQYDRVHRRWLRNEQGEILRTVYEHRQCKYEYDFTQAIAEDLKQHCIEWGYDYILKIIEDPTVNTFMNTVCKITNTYFFPVGDDMYGIEYHKKNAIGTVYKCGKHNEIKLGDVSIESIIAHIEQLDVSDFHKPYDEPFLRFHISSMSDYEVGQLKGLEREDFIRKKGLRSGLLDIGDLVTGKRIIVSDNLHYRPDVPHASWDDYITMFKEIWEKEEQDESN